MVPALMALFIQSLQAGSDTNLLHLTGAPQDLAPGFNPATTAYSGSTKSPWLHLSPVAADAEAVTEVRVNGRDYARVAPGATLGADSNYLVALKNDGGVLQWGSNQYYGSVVPPAGLGNVVSVACGYVFNVALLKNGTLRVWKHPELSLPATITGATGVAAVFTGSNHAYLVKNNGTLTAWSMFPLPAGGVSNVVSICQNDSMVVAAKADGSVVAWNASGLQPAFLPAGLSGVTRVACNAFNYAALRQDGTVRMWPDDSTLFGVLPKNPALKDVVSLCAGESFFLFLGRNGKVTALGHGPGTRVPSGLSGVTAIASGPHYGAALKQDGSLVTWGNVPPDNVPPPQGNLFATSPATLPVPLSPGANTVEVRLTPPAGTPAKTYTLSVNRTPDPALLLLDSDRGALTPAFSPELTSYTLSLPFANEGIRFRPLTRATGTTVTWNGTEVPTDEFSHPLTLEQGSNNFTFRATADDGSTVRDYEVIITRDAPSTNRTLRFLADDAGEMNPRFSPAHLTYTHTNPVRQPRLRVWPKAGAVSAKLEVRLNGGSFVRHSSGNPATLDGVIKPDGFPVWWDRTDLTKRIDPDHPVVPCGAMSNGGWGYYAIRTDGTVMTRNLFYAKVPAGLTDVVEVEEGVGGLAAALKGSGQVEAWDMATGNPATLFSGETQLITISGFGGGLAGIRRDGSLAVWSPPNAPNPTISPSQQSNLVDVGHATVLRSDGTAFARGNNVVSPTYATSGVAGLTRGWMSSFYHLKEDGLPGFPTGSQQDPLVFPENFQDLRLMRARSSDTLAVKKDGGVIAWGSVNDRRDGTGVPDGLTSQAFPEYSLLPLRLGTNLVEVRVTAENGEADTYSLTVLREANLELASVSLNNGEFPVSMAEGVSSFNVTVPPGRESITFAATLKDDTETMVLNGTPLMAGAMTTVALVPGANALTLEVLGQDRATSRTYTFNVTRSLAKAELLSLGTSAGPAVPAFAPSVHQYSRSTNRPDLVVWASPAQGELESRIAPNAPWQKMSRGSLVARGREFTAWLKADGTVSVRSFSMPEPQQPAALTGIRSIAAGNTHLMALRTEGTVVSWGYGPGAGVPTGLTNIRAVTAAADYSLVLKADGTVSGWGNNSHGQLNIPAGLDSVIAVNAQGGQAPWCLALRSNGTVAAWGAGVPGLLPSPAGLNGVVAITGLSEWKIQTGTDTRAAALLESGRVIFWDVLSGTPAQEFAPLHNIVAVSGALALRRDGALYHLAQGAVVAAPGVAALEGGMAVKQDGSVFQTEGAVVEVRPSWVALDVGPGVNPALEFRVTENESQTETRLDVTRTARTDLRFLAVDGPPLVPPFDRSVRSYDLGFHAGSNLRLRPAPANPNSVVEVRVNSGPWIRTASAEGFEDSESNTTNTQPVILRNNGKISGWDPKGFPAAPVSSADVFGRKAVSVARGLLENLVLLEDGTVLTALGYQVNYPELTVPPDLRNQTAISLGESHALALGEDGKVRAWGNSADEKLAVPDGLAGVVQVRTGKHHSLALRGDGTVVAWGLNTSGQTSVPAGLSGVVAIAAGHTQSMALKRDGTVVGWGTLGNGTTDVPAGLRDVRLIAADAGGCVAVREDGTAIRWGDAGFAYGPGASPTGWNGVLDLPPGYGRVLALLPDNLLVTWNGTRMGFRSDDSGQEIKPATASLLLRPGVNTIEVRVSEPDGSASAVTTLAVTRTPHAGLSSLKAGGFELTPAFDPAVENYTTEVAAGTTSMPLRLSTQETDATVTVNGTALSGGSTLIPLPTGALGPVVIAVTSADGTVSRTFQIQVSRALPSTATGLGLLTTGIGPLSPAFDPLVKSYQQDFRFSLASIRAVPMGTGARMEVSLNGGAWQNLFHGQRLAQTQGSSLIMGSGGVVRSWPDPGPGSLFALPEGLTEAVSVAAYHKHMLALKSDGTVVGWGDNSQGQASVPDGLRDVISIAAGNFHSMALRQNGTVVVWGAGASGVTNVPAGLTDVIAISAGTGHCLALRNDGTVVTWGTIPPALAVPGGLSGITAIAAVNNFSTALRQDGTPVSWGTSPPIWPATSFPALLDPWGVGVVGAEGLVTPSAPGGGGIFIPADLGPVVSLLGNRAVGLAVRTDGSVRQWGAGALIPPANTAGDTRPLFLPFPLQHGLNTAVVRITAEDGISQDTYQIGINRLPNTGLSVLRLTPNTLSPAYQDEVTVYSASVPFYQTSIELTATAADPTSVVFVNGASSATGKTVIPLNPGVNTIVVDVAAADGVTTRRRTITVTRQASLATWNLRGLGTNAGGVMNSFAPDLYTYAATPPAGDILYWPRAASAGAALSYRRNGGAWQLLNGTGNPPFAGNSAFVIALRNDGTVASWSTDPNVPAVPAGLGDVVAVSAGNNHAMALNSMGGVVVWGSGSATLQPPAGMAETAAIASGRDHCLALGLTGTVTAWGRNFNQQTNVPATLPPAMAVAGGSGHSLALARDGRVFSWGSMAQSTVPANLPPVVAIAAGDQFTVVLKNDGTVAAWGDNTHGQRNVPASLSDVVQIACGGRHVLALGRDGKVTAWGDNSSGQRTVPPDLTDVVAVNAGGSLSLAVKRDGRLVVWGISTAGQRNIPANLIMPALDSFAALTPLPGPASTEFRVVSPDGLDSRTYSVNVTMSLQAAYTAWSAGAFPAGSAAAVTAAGADFDRDGVVNLMEYVNGTPPASFSPAPLGFSITEDGMLELRWPRRAGLADGWEVVEGSPSLQGPWSAVALDGFLKTPGSPGNPDILTLRLPLPENRYFMRLRVPNP